MKDTKSIAINVVVTLPKYPDRGRAGRLAIVDQNGSGIYRCLVLGKADGQRATKEGNPSRNPLLPFGDTPTGLWAAARGRVVAPRSTYGPNPVMMLSAMSGDAVKAAKRSGIWLHGGDPGTAEIYGFLRPTYGCLRVADEDMRQIWLLADKFGQPKTLEVKEAV